MTTPAPAQNQNKKRNQREIGLYEARAINSYTIPTKEGAQAAIEYEYKDTVIENGTEKTVLKKITGTFALSGNALEYTLEKLSNSGYLFGDDNLVDFHEGKGFAPNHKCQIAIIEEEGEATVDQNTGLPVPPKWYKKVSFVNLLGGAIAQKKMAKEEHIQKMQGLNIASGVAAFRAKNNIQKPAKAAVPSTGSEQPSFGADDIPF